MTECNHCPFSGGLTTLVLLYKMFVFLKPIQFVIKVYYQIIVVLHYVHIRPWISLGHQAS